MRCASTTWKMSPARMCSFAVSTARMNWSRDTVECGSLASPHDRGPIHDSGLPRRFVNQADREPGGEGIWRGEADLQPLAVLRQGRERAPSKAEAIRLARAELPVSPVQPERALAEIEAGKIELTEGEAEKPAE